MCELHEYSRLIVRIGETLTAMAQSQRRNLGWHHICSLHFPPLAYVEVLAVRAEPVTSRRGYGEYLRARHVMSNGLLLYRINVSGNHFPIDQEVEFAANILPDPTQSNLPLRNVAVASAGCASDPLVGEWLVQLRLSYHFKLLYWAIDHLSTATAQAILGQSTSNPFPYLLSRDVRCSDERILRDP